MLSPDTIQALQRRHKNSTAVVNTATNAVQQTQMTSTATFNHATEAMVNRQYVISRLVPSDEKVYDQLSLEYFRVDFLSEVELNQPIIPLHSPHNNGSIVITNKRMIFLAAEHVNVTNFENKPPYKSNISQKPAPGLNGASGYKVNISLYDKIAYFSIPLSNIQHGVSIDAEHDVEAESSVYYNKSGCFSCCGKNCKQRIAALIIILIDSQFSLLVLMAPHIFFVNAVLCCRVFFDR
jgi:hypothetical protein